MPRTTLLLLICYFLFNTNTVGQEDVTAHKMLLTTDLAIEKKKETLFAIVEHYKQRGQLDRDSIRKYNNQLLELMKDEPVSKQKATAKAYRLLADFRLPYEQYAPLAKELIGDYRELEIYEGVLQEQFYLANKAHHSQYSESFQLYEEGLKMTEQFEGLLDDAVLCRYKSRFASSLASNYEFVQLYNEAIDQSLNAIEIAESCQDSMSLLYAYRSSGAIVGNALEDAFYNQKAPASLSGDLEKFLIKTYDLSKALKQEVIFTNACYNLATYNYHNLSFEKALFYLDEANSVQDIQWMPRQIYLNNVLKSSILQDQRKVEESFAALEEASKGAKKLNEPFYDKSILLDISNWYAKEDQNEKALEYLFATDTLTKEHLDLEVKYYKLLYRIKKEQKVYGPALEAHEQYKILQDSLAYMSSMENISSLKSQYDLSVANNEIADLRTDNLLNQLNSQKQRTTILVISFSIIGCILGFAVYFRQRLMKTEQARQKVTQKLFRAQMNPHFIFNTLGSIQSFLLQDGKSKEAAYYLTKFGGRCVT